VLLLGCPVLLDERRSATSPAVAYARDWAVELMARETNYARSAHPVIFANVPQPRSPSDLEAVLGELGKVRT
jgi:hypothetical protein